MCLKLLPSSVVSYIGDSSHVIQLAKDPQAASRSCHSSLFQEIFDLIAAKQLVCNFFWMPSHADTDPKKAELLPDWATDWYVQGNKQADTEATRAARCCQLDLNYTKQYLRMYNMCAKVQLRYVDIIKHMAARVLPSDLRRDPVPKQKSTYSLHSLISQSSHAVVATATMVSCAVCCSRVSTANHSTMTDFLCSDCVPVVNSESPQPQQLCTPVSINNRLSHHSHALASAQDTIFCTKCWYRGSFMLRKLVLPCLGIPTANAKRYLDTMSLSQPSLAPVQLQPPPASSTDLVPSSSSCIQAPLVQHASFTVEAGRCTGHAISGTGTARPLSGDDSSSD